MAKKAKTQDEMPEGYKKLTGTLPPFFTLEVGDMIDAVLEKVRVKVEKSKKGVSYDLKYDFKAKGPFKGSRGNKKNKERVVVEEGEVVTISGSGALDRELTRQAVLAAGGNEKDEDSWPTPDEVKWEGIVGSSFYIKRIEGTPKKNKPYKGAIISRFDIAMMEKEAVPA